MIYRLVLKIRHWLYDTGRKKSFSAEVPTICVGNITAGGTGKTPHTEMILRTLLQSDEWGMKDIAVLSRGYKRESKGFQQVTSDGSAIMFGDEPLQIKKNFPSVTVAVDKDRIEGCRFLCHPETMENDKAARACQEKNFPAADLIVLDDAFQYRKLKADMNILLVDFNRPVCKDKLLPFGGLRDLPSRLGEADVIIVTKCPYFLDADEKKEWAESLGVSEYSTDSFTGKTNGGKSVTVLFSYIEYCEPGPMFENSNPRYVYAQKMILFSGIANDTPLVNFLSDKYKVVRRFRFSDHHKYKKGDIRSILKATKQFPTAAVATTEKDSQRILDCNGIPDRIRERLLVVPIRVKFLSEEEETVFARILAGVRKTE